MAVGRTNAGGGSGKIPEVGFVPSEWNSKGYITAGRWYGTMIPSGMFSGSGRGPSGLSALKKLEHSGITHIEDSAFYDCINLTTADFPLVKHIKDAVFLGCESLTTINIPLAESIESNGFQSCKSLSAVNFQFVELIGDYAFQNCTNLITADFSLVEYIDSSAFHGCNKLTSLTLRRTSLCTLSDKNAFSGTPIASGTGYIYVPAALVSSYKSATNWSVYANQIKAI